jgi:hypothetical protein
MQGGSDNTEWQEALRREGEGDPSMLAALLVCSAPLNAQERVAAALRKLPRRRPPSDNTTRLAKAVVHFETHEGSARYDELLVATCEKFRIKTASVLQTALERHRSDVNPLLDEWNWEKPKR